MKLLIVAVLVLSQGIYSADLADKLTARRNKSAKKVPPEMKKKMKAGVQKLKDMNLVASALGVGKKLPTINLIDSKKRRVSLNELISGSAAVVTFYRGGWCPYCMLELDHYETMISDFEKAGAKIIAISPDSPMEALKTKKKRNLSYMVLSDPDNRAAKQMGIAFKLDQDTLEIYGKFGIDLKKSQGNSSNELPMPGTYVIDASGVIRYSFVDPDYTKRAEPAKVLEVVQKVSKRN